MTVLGDQWQCCTACGVSEMAVPQLELSHALHEPELQVVVLRLLDQWLDTPKVCLINRSWRIAVAKWRSQLRSLRTVLPGSGAWRLLFPGDLLAPLLEGHCLEKLLSHPLISHLDPSTSPSRVPSYARLPMYGHAPSSSPRLELVVHRLAHECRSLTELTLSSTAHEVLSTAALRALVQNCPLESLSLSRVVIEAGGLPELGQCDRLKRLRLHALPYLDWSHHVFIAEAALGPRALRGLAHGPVARTLEEFCVEGMPVAHIPSLELMLGSCPNLQSFSLLGCGEGIPAELVHGQLSAHNRFTSLGLTYMKCDQDDPSIFQAVSQYCSGLRLLDLSFLDSEASESFEDLAACTGLQELVLNSSEGIDPSRFRAFTEQCTLLTRIWLRGCTWVTQEAVSCLSGLTLLTDLDLSCTGITDYAVGRISGSLAGVNRLRLNCYNLSDVGMAHVLQSVSRLEYLSVLNGGALSDESLSQVSRSQALTVLAVSQAVLMTDASVGAICTSCCLRELALFDCPLLTDETVRSIRMGCPGLRKLQLGPQFASEPSEPEYGLGAGLECGVYERRGLFTDESLVQLGQGCAELSSVVMRGCAAISDTGVDVLSQSCQKLKLVDLIGCDGLSELAAKSVALNCPDLRWINGVPLSDESLFALVMNCPRFQYPDMCLCTSDRRYPACYASELTVNLQERSVFPLLEHTMSDAGVALANYMYDVGIGTGGIGRDLYKDGNVEDELYVDGLF